MLAEAFGLVETYTYSQRKAGTRERKASYERSQRAEAKNRVKADKAEESGENPNAHPERAAREREYANRTGKAERRAASRGLGSGSDNVRVTPKDRSKMSDAERKEAARTNLAKLKSEPKPQLAHTEYGRIGLALAEAFGLIEGADAPMKGSPRGVNLGEPGKGSTESRKASYNVQAQRKMNQAAKEREKAKENR